MRRGAELKNQAKSGETADNRRALVADIGGTNARFAVADLEMLAIEGVREFSCSDFLTLGEVIEAYLRDVRSRPGQAAFAIAAPVVGETIRFTNSPWSCSVDELCRSAQLESVHLLNDFQALALSLPHLGPDELHRIGGGEGTEHGTKVVLGPGTGLGVGGLLWSGSGWVPITSEGGHVTFAVEDARELAIIEVLRGDRERVSAERILSGPGLAELYVAVASVNGRPFETLEPSEVAQRALTGSDDIAVEALDLFVSWLGRFAGDAALLFGALGGVYLGGGIPRKILGRLTTGAFHRAFGAKGRMGLYLASVPVYVILAEFAALTGAAAFLQQQAPSADD